MLNIKLKKAHFRRFSGSFCDISTSTTDMEKLFSEQVGLHIHDSLEGIGNIDIHSHHLCSTIIDIPFGSKVFDWQRIQSQIAEQTSFAPQSFLNAYECAGWGYSLRHALRNQKETRNILITVVDLNLLNLDYWLANSNWGDSGFGIITLLLECDPESINNLNVGGALSSNAVAEFTIQMRNENDKRENTKLAHPYFPKNVTDLFYKLVPKADFLPDWHSEFGHCFGADPWISLIKNHQQSPSVQSYIIGSVALNGYWALAHVSTTEETTVHLSEATL